MLMQKVTSELSIAHVTVIKELLTVTLTVPTSDGRPAGIIIGSLYTVTNKFDTGNSTL